MSNYDEYRDRILRMLPDVQHRIAEGGEGHAADAIASYLFAHSRGSDPLAVPTIAAVALVALAVEHIGQEVRGA